MIHGFADGLNLAVFQMESFQVSGDAARGVPTNGPHHELP
jgi:hypothetical protein